MGEGKMKEEIRFENPERRQNPPMALEPEKNKKIYAMKSGEILLQEHANVSIDNLGFTRGLTVFTVMEARGEVIFYLDAHIERLRSSAVSAYITTGNQDAETWTILFRNQIKKLLKLNGFKESVVKIFMTAGTGEAGFLPKGSPTTYITVEDKSEYPVKESVRLGVMKFERRFPHIKKTDDYSSAIIEMMNLKRQGIEVDDMLYVGKIDFFRNYKLLECSRANIFAITCDNELITPSANDILSGITRNIVLKLAKNRKELRCAQEKDILLYNLTCLTTFKEVFITSTTKGVMPVVSIYGFSPPPCLEKRFEIGELTLKLKQDFNDYREEYFKSREA